MKREMEHLTNYKPSVKGTKREKMSKMDFRYSNSVTTNLLWILFGLAGGLLLLLQSKISILNSLFLWLIDEFGIVGLILVLVFALTECILLMLGSYYLSLKISDRRGAAIFGDDGVRIAMDGKERIINYSDITAIKYSEIVIFMPMRYGGMKRSGYKLEIKTESKVLKIRSSLKELWENRIKELKQDFCIIKLSDIPRLNKYHTTLKDVYDETKLQKKQFAKSRKKAKLP
jgi:hypothetical protein